VDGAGRTACAARLHGDSAGRTRTATTDQGGCRFARVPHHDAHGVAFRPGHSGGELRRLSGSGSRQGWPVVAPQCGTCVEARRVTLQQRDGSGTRTLADEMATTCVERWTVAHHTMVTASRRRALSLSERSGEKEKGGEDGMGRRQKGKRPCREIGQRHQKKGGGWATRVKWLVG
jgi:hypothetical protein